MKGAKMLKGKTTLSMNKETIIAAVQMYLDATFKETHKVTNIESSSTGYQNSLFTVEIEAEPAKTA